MYNNWSEIIEILSPVIGCNRSRAEIKMALESSLRTLGWRSSTGSMLNDYRVNTGKIIDIVLGHKEETGTFHVSLPIFIYSNAIANDINNTITSVMVDVKVKIAIVVGNTFDLFFFDEKSDSAIKVSQISFEPEDKNGISLTSLLSASDFNEDRVISYFSSLYEAQLPAMKLNSLISSIIADKHKTEEVLRTYLELEGFAGEIVDKLFETIGIDIYFKNKSIREANPQKDNDSDKSYQKGGHDNTRFSLNGGKYMSKRSFVHSVIAQYIKDNPYITLEELESRFPSELASKVRGVVRTWAQVQSWAEQNGPDILTRYCTKADEILSLHDGTEIVVNSQWGSKNFPKFLAVAKTIYNISSDAPYDGTECTGTIEKDGSTRAKNFKFSMAGIKIGESIVFDAANIEVGVVSDDMIEYKGSRYRLSAFVRAFLPDSMRTPSDAYRGPDFFSYKGVTLTELRNKNVKKQEEIIDNNNGCNGIQISLQSFNTFKTKK